MSRRRVMTLERSWADRLGLDSAADVHAELRSRFEHLARYVLAAEMPPAGRGTTAEGAAAHGQLWLLAGFLADARRALTGEEGDQR